MYIIQYTEALLKSRLLCTHTQTRNILLRWLLCWLYICYLLKGLTTYIRCCFYSVDLRRLFLIKDVCKTVKKKKKKSPYSASILLPPKYNWVIPTSIFQMTQIFHRSSSTKKIHYFNSVYAYRVFPVL